METQWVGGAGRVMRAALYLRVSTKDQTVENQERELRTWAKRLGFDVLEPPFAETVSGGRNDRAALTAVFEAAHRRAFDVLLIWSLDRLSREGIGATARHLDRLRTVGVRVMSHQEAWLDTGGPVGELLVAVFAFAARQEHDRLSERVKVGMARARAAGVHIGRSPRSVDVQDVQRRRARGQSWRRIARALKTPVKTLRRHSEAWQNHLGELCRATEPSARVVGGGDGC